MKKSDFQLTFISLRAFCTGHFNLTKNKNLKLLKLTKNPGGLDKIGLPCDTGNAHTHGLAELAFVGDPQRPQHVETSGGRRTARGLGNLHVPGQHRPHEESGR